MNYGVEIKRYEEGIEKPGGSPRVQGEEWQWSGPRWGSGRKGVREEEFWWENERRVLVGEWDRILANSTDKLWGK